MHLGAKREAWWASLAQFLGFLTYMLMHTLQGPFMKLNTHLFQNTYEALKSSKAQYMV